MKYSVAEHISQSAHATWNFLCSCSECDGYFIKVRKTDVPAILKNLGHNGYVTVEEWDSINHRLVSLNKKKA